MRLNPFYTYYYQWNSKIVQHKSTRPHQIKIIHKKFNYKRYLFKRKKKNHNLCEWRLKTSNFTWIMLGHSSFKLISFKFNRINITFKFFNLIFD
jgi:hypothetical protein